MKFCKVLEDQGRDLPELQHLFLRYKALKKKINAIGAAASDAAANHGTTADGGDGGPSSVASSGLSTEETEFVATLNEDLERFNSFFMEKEEEEVIKIQALADRLESATSAEQLSDVTQGLINLHGELVLVLHWSLINYSAIVKILKKHDKRTGVFLRAPYLANVLQQPFASTSMMTRLVKRAEQLVSNATTRAHAEGIAQQRDVQPATGAEAKHEVAAEMPPDAEVATATGTGDAMAAAAAVLQARAIDSSDEEDDALMKMADLQGPIAKRAKMVLDIWRSLAKSASTPSTILPTEALQQAGLIKPLTPGMTHEDEPASKKIKTN